MFLLIFARCVKIIKKINDKKNCYPSINYGPSWRNCIKFYEKYHWSKKVDVINVVINYILFLQNTSNI